MASEADGEFQAFEGEGASRRRHRRWYVDFKTTIQIGDEICPCNVYDLSPGGACIEAEGVVELVAGSQFIFELPGYGAILSEVRYSGDGYQGVMFLHEDADEVALARYLVEVEQNRRPERHDVTLQASLRASGVELPCVVEDISRTGARVVIDDTRHISGGQDVTLFLAGVGQIYATVRRHGERELGLMFLAELSHDFAVAKHHANGTKAPLWCRWSGPNWRQWSADTELAASKSPYRCRDTGWLAAAKATSMNKSPFKRHR